MPAALLDTNAISDLMRDHAAIKARIRTHGDLILTSVVAIGEIRYGLDRLPAGKKRTDLESRAGAILAAISIEPITADIAETYGRLKAAMEIQGVIVDDNDLWIAATAIANGHLIVTRDQVFTQVPGLIVENWTI